jgi:hypothetical protein
VVKNALVDPDPSFPIFYFPHFIFSRQRPSLRRAANDIPWFEAGGAAGGDDGGCHNHNGGGERRDDVMPN